MNPRASVASGEYILHLFERVNRVAILALNRDFRETAPLVSNLRESHVGKEHDR
jgi:hypothetical protein